MKTQALSALLASIMALAIGVSVLLRDRRQPTYVRFAVLTVTLAAYYLLTFAAASVVDDPWFHWAALWPAAFIPTTALRFFRAFLAEPGIGVTMRLPAVTYASAAGWGVALTYGALFEPIHQELWFEVPFAAYVFGGLYRCVISLYLQYRATVPRVEKARIRYLMVTGFVAITLSLCDFLPRIGIPFPTIGPLLTVLYLYFLSQTLFRYRLLDLHELVGRMLVLGSLLTILTIVYGLLLIWVGGGKQQGLFILNTIVASFVILILFEPVRSLLDTAINRWLVRERGELRQRADSLRRELMNVIDGREMVRVVIAYLEASRRVTHAAVYLVDADGAGYDLAGWFGTKPVERLELAARRPFFDRLRAGPVMLETLERELAELEAQRGSALEKGVEILDAIALTLGESNASLAVPILGGGGGTTAAGSGSGGGGGGGGNNNASSGSSQSASGSGSGSGSGDAGDVVLGVLCLRDERFRNPFGVDDLDVLRMVAAQAAIAMENSDLYERMKERDRLAALGEMAAGLAHEIRNPLGAIKGAAQLLVDPDGKPLAAGTQDVSEFLAIIVDEVNRLNRVVSQFLDYARPYKGDSTDLSINEVIRRTVQLLEGEANSTGVSIDLDLDERLPRIRGDAQHLHQVFLNLGLNAIQATPRGGRLSIATSFREKSRRRGQTAPFAEIHFKDTGTGIPREHLKNLFIPFFTTKEQGTGLGLPISQRIVNHHGGTIEVRSQPGRGSTFTVLLPAVSEAGCLPGAGTPARSSSAGA
ncbi:MAG: ATP-binding protein [Pseudomonadota bacterium]